MPPFRLYVMSDEQTYPHALAKLFSQLSRKNEVGFQIHENLTPKLQKRLVNSLTDHVSSGEHSTEWHSTGWHSTGWHSTGWHSTDHFFHCYLSDRADLALSLGLTGVHLNDDSISCQHLHPLFKQNLSIGVSTHSVDDVLQAKQNGVDFVTLGPIYPITVQHPVPNSKCENPLGRTPLGLSVLRKAAQLCNLPIFASGGVTLENAMYCLEAGAYGITVKSAIWETLSPLEAIEKFERIIMKHLIRKSFHSSGSATKMKS